MYLSTIENFADYSERIKRVDNENLASEYMDLYNMREADITNGYCVEIIDSFFEIVTEEIGKRFVKLVSES